MARHPEDSIYRISSEYQNRMKFIIAESEMKKADFAKAAGVGLVVISRATVYGILPSTRSLVKMADYLGVPMEYLLGESDEKDFYPTEKFETFQDRLNLLMNERKLKISEISHFMSFPRNSIHEWMRRNNLPALDYLKELAEFFNVSIDFLLGRTDFRD